MDRTRKQEAHGPWLALLSETATADMQMLCNIFPILLLQLFLEGSSFKQFLVLKKKNVLLFFLLSLFYHIWA